jgi:ribosomal protein L21
LVISLLWSVTAEAATSICQVSSRIPSEASGTIPEYLMFDDAKSTVKIGSNSEWKKSVKAKVKKISKGKKITWEQTVFADEIQRNTPVAYNLRLFTNGKSDLYAASLEYGLTFKVKVVCKTK